MLALVVKAKLESVESGIVSFEEEFAPFVVLPDGKSVAEHIVPAINEVYETRSLPSIFARGALGGLDAS